MFDRASTFADPEIVAMLRDDFVPVAIDQAYQRRQRDAEGERYRHIALQGPRHDFANASSQGFYVATPGGELLFYNNNRNPARLRRLMRETLDDFTPSAGDEVEPVPERGEPDPRYNPEPPEGGLVVRVRAKVLEGYAPTDDPDVLLFQQALSRDNLWVTAREHDALVQGEFPRSLARRIARFHLVDNTRGEPAMWHLAHIKALEMGLDGGVVVGWVRLENDEGDRRYDAVLRGRVTVEDGRVTGFALAAEGTHEGHGRYTPQAPDGPFTLAVCFTLADGEDPADAIPPQGSRGWVDGYLRR